MSPFGLKFSQMILHTETRNLMYNWSFLFVVLHKPTLLPSTFNLLTIVFRTDETDCKYLMYILVASTSTINVNVFIVNHFQGVYFLSLLQCHCGKQWHTRQDFLVSITRMLALA